MDFALSNDSRYNRNPDFPIYIFTQNDYMKAGCLNRQLNKKEIKSKILYYAPPAEQNQIYFYPFLMENICCLYALLRVTK